MFFGREIIEVATFRAASAPSQGEEPLPDADPEDGEAPELDDPQLEATQDARMAAPRIAARCDGRGGPESAAASAARATSTYGVDGGRTFATSDPETDTDVLAERMFDETGRILRDNVYGTIDEDVWRRDFTANSLYYNIADFSIWDYVGGAEDIAARTLRLIGDPETRFREDPVRMLRAARFEAKLGFAIDPATAEPIGRLRELLGGVPPARLFDETLKLFLTGHGERSSRCCVGAACWRRCCRPSRPT